MLLALQKANPQMKILPLSDPSFLRYGMPVESAPLAGLFQALEDTTAIPAAGDVYVASDPTLEALPAFSCLQDGFYGGMPIQIGYCNGNNHQLGALEYHRGCEVTLAATDCVLLLAHFSQIQEGHLDSGCVTAYYAAKGEAFALFESTLHFAPCAVLKSGFKTGIVLPKGTNTPFALPGAPVFSQDSFLFMRNKWLIAHADSAPAKNDGAYVGITGENLTVHTAE